MDRKIYHCYIRQSNNLTICYCINRLKMKIFLPLILSLVFPWSAFSKEINQTSPYKMRMSLFASLNHHRDVVMLGDSITARAEWSELLPDVSVANRGIGGDEIQYMALRLGSVLSVSPKVVFIMGGVNDFGHRRKSNDVFNDYKKIINYLSSRNIKVKVQSTLYISRENRLDNNTEIHKLNVSLKSYCEESAECSFINLNEHMSLNGEIRPQYTGDGIHLTGDGYQKWASIIYPIAKQYNK
ncbi:hypothetical protein KFU66_07190 [Escherichia coli]|uniref:GDSL-type esterase/lipase family protein n=1 Tax=Escherichia coli TaxID=562 RepID=UPI001A19A30E|nr:GDSL-type esterase/lipase family protein [Escherichia coli]UUQ34052.1 hypothetical protein KFU66_07190 [Escherichia coli]HAV2436445.1 hypothetical protein [Escherichia coli]HBC8293615.1 hypothetical protein [Escherichia coli]HCJ8741989.1 hypothetical protein [Escherichia coli]HEC4611538.1 hypothetical protein [Escherichia coli]